MTTPPPRFVVESIAEDSVFLLRLFKTIIGTQYAGALIPAMVPIASLFVVESCARLDDYSPTAPAGGVASAVRRMGLLRACRHRTKLLLSSKSDVGALVANFDRIVRQERAAFLGPHTGWLGPLKRWIQPDVGIFFSNGHMFSTGHGTRFILGEHARSPEVLREIGESIGSYCASIARALAKSAALTPFDVRESPSIAMQDIKCESLYRRGALGTLELPWAGVLAMVLANVNFVGRILPLFVSEDSRTLAKFRLLYAYHAAHSLRLVQDRLTADGTLTPPAAEVLKCALGTRDSRWLRKRKDLRDTLMHFQPSRSSPELHSLSLDEVVGGLLGNRSSADLPEIISSVLDGIGTALVGGFELGPRTFWYGTVSTVQKVG